MPQTSTVGKQPRSDIYIVGVYSVSSLGFLLNDFVNTFLEEALREAASAMLPSWVLRCFNPALALALLEEVVPGFGLRSAEAPGEFRAGESSHRDFSSLDLCVSAMLCQLRSDDDSHRWTR